MRKPRVSKDAKEKSTKPTKAAGSNTIDPEKRALFLSNKDAYSKASEKLKKAQAAVRSLGKIIKSDGFSIKQIKLAIQLETPEGEAEFKASVANGLLAAQYVGAAIGSQLSMFMEPDLTPAVDIAADEGQKDALEHKPARPKYDPSTPQYASYMAAYAETQGSQLKSGIQPLEVN